MKFIINNLSSIIVLGLLVATLVLVSVIMFKRRKIGKKSCGCDCAFCNKDCDKH